MVSVASACAKKQKDTKLRLLEGWDLAAARTSDCVREHGGKECSQTLNVPGTHLSWKYTHTHTHRVMIPSVSLLFKQLQPAVTPCVGSFTAKQSFQTLAFPYYFHPGYIPGSALSRLDFFPCLVSVSPFSSTYPLQCHGCSGACSKLFVDALDGRTMCGHAKEGVDVPGTAALGCCCLGADQTVCGAPVPASKESKNSTRMGKPF